MARLSSQQRKNMPASSFAVPSQRAYPVNDPNHARNALARVSQFGSPAQKQQVRSKVRRRFPGIGGQDAEVPPGQEAQRPKPKRRKVRRKPPAY